MNEHKIYGTGFLPKVNVGIGKFILQQTLVIKSYTRDQTCDLSIVKPPDYPLNYNNFPKLCLEQNCKIIYSDLRVKAPR